MCRTTTFNSVSIELLCFPHISQGEFTASGLHTSFTGVIVQLCFNSSAVGSVSLTCHQQLCCSIRLLLCCYTMCPSPVTLSLGCVFMLPATFPGYVIRRARCSSYSWTLLPLCQPCSISKSCRNVFEHLNTPSCVMGKWLPQIRMSSRDFTAAWSPH